MLIANKSIGQTLRLSAMLVAMISTMLFSTSNLRAEVKQFEFENTMAAPVAGTPRLAKQSRPKGTNKIGGFLQQVLNASVTGVNTKRAAISDSAFVRTKNSASMQVYISLTDASDDHVRALENMGVDVEVVNRDLNKVQGWLDADSIDTVAQESMVLKVAAPKYAQVRSGSVNTQGDSILRADELRAKGFTGKGVRVGIVSDGSNDFATAQASGDLPANLTRFGRCSSRVENVQQCIRSSSCNEGTAMAEIIHDIAPDAELAIASVNTSLEFIQRINQLANEFKADVIVDDLGFFGEPYFQDGDLAKAVAALPKHVLYVSAAGNSANNHYENNYRSFTADDGRSFHDFGAVAGQATNISIGFIVPANSGVVTLLQWNDDFGSPSNDYDLTVVNQANDTLLGQSIADQASGAEPIEATCTFNLTSQDVAQFAFVDRFSGSSRRLEMFHLGAPAIEFPVPQGSIFGHPGVARAIAVGTINADDPGNNDIAFYSSQGPVRIDFPTRADRAKPDLTGIDGVSVTGAGGFPSTFFGTSAAAPHVAGVAAQLLSTGPMVKPENVRRALTTTAVDLGANGRDSVFGFGRVDAALAEAALLKGVNPVSSLLLLLLDEEEN